FFRILIACFCTVLIPAIGAAEPQDKTNARAFLDAACKGNLAEVQRLVKENPLLVRAVTKSGEPVVDWAAENGQIEIVEFLGKTGAESKLDIFDAAKFGVLFRIKALLKENPKLVNAKDSTVAGLTPLHRAAEFGQRAVALLLLQRKADVNAG